MFKILIVIYLSIIIYFILPLVINIISNSIQDPLIYSHILKIFLFLIIPITIVMWLIYLYFKSRDKFIKSFQVVKSVNKLKPYNDFEIINYDSNSYIDRLGNEYIKKLMEDIEQCKNIKFIGMYKVGKTREAFELIRKLKNYIFIKPKENLDDIKNIKYPYFIKKNFVIFLDDIQKYNDTIIKNLKEYFKNKKCKFAIIATARIGTENEEFESQNETVEFKEVYLRTITNSEKNKLITGLGKNLQDINIFNGTPGSITLSSTDILLIIKSKYIKFEDCRYIYKAIKLLKNGGLGLAYFKKEYIKKICEMKFKINDEKEWFRMLKYLKENFLITYSDYYIDVPTYEYINYCVFDYLPTEDDFILLENLVLETKNQQDIYCLAHNYMSNKQFEKSKKCFEDILAINSKSLLAYRGLGILFFRWGKEEKYNDGSKEKVKYYFEQAEKIFRETFFKYPKNNTDIGVQWVLTAEILKNPKEVIDIYRKLFKIQPHNEKLMRVYLKFLEIHNIKIDENIYNINKLTANQNAFLGEYLRKLGKYELAMKYINKSLRLDQNNPYANENKGILVEIIGDLAKKQDKFRLYIEAEKYYKIAIDNHIWHASARRLYACFLYKKMKKNEEANMEFNRISQEHSEYIENERDYGIFLIEKKRDIPNGMKKIQRAIDEFKKKRGKEKEVEKLEECIKKYNNINC